MTTARLHFDMVVIGFGKGGKTLAGAYAKTGKNVALIEQSSDMYGGTCINIGCVPTKALVHRADEFRASGEHNDDAANAAYESAVISVTNSLVPCVRRTAKFSNRMPRQTY